MPETRWWSKCPVCGWDLYANDRRTLETRIDTHVRKQHRDVVMKATYRMVKQERTHA